MGVLVAVGTAVGLGVDVTVGVGVTVGVTAGVSSSVGVTVAAGSGVGVNVAAAAGVSVAVGVTTIVGVQVDVASAISAGEGVSAVSVSFFKLFFSLADVKDPFRSISGSNSPHPLKRTIQPPAIRTMIRSATRKRRNLAYLRLFFIFPPNFCFTSFKTHCFS